MSTAVIHYKGIPWQEISYDNSISKALDEKIADLTYLDLDADSDATLFDLTNKLITQSSRVFVILELSDTQPKGIQKTLNLLFRNKKIRSNIFCVGRSDSLERILHALKAKYLKSSDDVVEEIVKLAN